MKRGRSRGAVLTRRETDVLQHLMAGLTRSEIAAELDVSVNTIRSHIYNLLGKLGCRSSLAATALARDAGLRPAPLRTAPSGPQWPGNGPAHTPPTLPPCDNVSPPSQGFGGAM